MKNKFLGLSIIGLLVVMLSMGVPIATHAQDLPELSMQWEPWNDSGVTTTQTSDWMAWPPSSTDPTSLPYAGITGPVGPAGSGMSFVMYFENRNFTRVVDIPDNQLPFYMLIDTPAGTSMSIAWCIVYYPPSYQIRQMVFSNYVLSSGTQRLPAFNKSPGDPSGSYAFKVWMISRDMSGIWRPSEQVAYVNLGTPPVIPPQVVKPSIVSFKANKNKVKAGESITLSWSIQGATSAKLNDETVNAGSASKEFQDMQEDTTFTLVASNSAGYDSSEKTVVVEQVNWLLWILVGLLAVAAAAIGVILSRQRRPVQVAPSYPGTYGPGAPPTMAGTRAKTAVGGQPSTVVARAKLVLSDNSEVPIGNGTSWIGRREVERILSPQDREFLSRQHAMFICEGGRYFVEDQGSANGTKVNGAEIRGTGRRELKDGDSIQFANVATARFVIL